MIVNFSQIDQKAVDLVDELEWASMILVIADDLSGAAELSSIAFAHGMTAEVQTEFQPQAEARVICLDINTRRLSADETTAVLRKLAKHVRTARPEIHFKKTDSALRGNIGAELGVLLEITARVRTVFVPANPSRGRTIRGGEYWSGDTPRTKRISPGTTASVDHGECGTIRGTIQRSRFPMPPTKPMC